MKPDTTTVMRDLVDRIRQTMPFDEPDTWICKGTCHGCSLKLLEYLDMELEDIEHRLDGGDVPNFGDLNKLVKTAKKIYIALYNNGLVNEPYDKLISTLH